ncbi:MAG: type II toxin-antitoxin system VapC family toxin [Tannerella sp.]|uniref:type II toxin-antitoxin system VapC family toxin n=1 Tax=Tannerella sp. TaxID=2382127 RepID=UPI003FA22B98
MSRTRLFLDTNVILDFMKAREPFCKGAAQIFELAYQGVVETYVSSLSFCNTHYIFRKDVGAQDSIVALNKLKQIVKISPVSEQEVTAALHSDFPDFEDALQYYSAMAVHASIIISRNGKDFKQSSIPVMTADTFIESLSI